MNNTTILYSGKWLDIRFRNNREYMVRTRGTGAAILIPVTDHHEIVLVEQYRASLDTRVLELPAGIVGDEQGMEKESCADAAKRELLEETGYEAGSILQMAEGPVSAGVSDEVMTFFYCDGLIKRTEGGGVESEDITVHVVPLDSIDSYIGECSRKGMLIDAKIYLGLYFIQKNKS